MQWGVYHVHAIPDMQWGVYHDHAVPDMQWGVYHVHTAPDMQWGVYHVHAIPDMQWESGLQHSTAPCTLAVLVLQLAFHPGCRKCHL
jgi:hypothetical protein